MDQERTITASTIEWEGITIELRYEPDWLGMAAKYPNEGYGHAHLELRSIAPSRSPLPVTETGYRSHFLPRGEVEATGGPAAYARAWLDQAAREPAWRRQQEAARQLSLF
jgi:hypothetical protein